ncbi:MoaD/ThiS family protein [Synechocystis sp. LKSZ1]|uniref:MoaD/ThiS family protein n=1 Tax=Synechocystis sp. LKSZ1 TaxID=3144951 RepID=UPI00336C11BA
MTSVTVKYFAALREAALIPEETIHTEASTYRGLYRELTTQYGFSLPEDAIRVAIDDDFADLDDDLKSGVTVVFIPPVAGG